MLAPHTDRWLPSGRSVAPFGRLFFPGRRLIVPGRTVLFAVLAISLAGAASPVWAAPAAWLAPDREIASVGDLVSIHMQHDVGLAIPIGGLAFTYVLPSTAIYVPQSVIVNGTPTPDGGRVLVTADSVRVSISVARLGVNSVEMQLRVVGSIGQPVAHRGAVKVGSNAAFGLYGPATWIEDETATIQLPALGSDTYLSKIEPGFNYGTSPSIAARTSSEYRPLLKFNVGPIANGSVVHAAYLELWPTLSSGASVTLSAHRVRSSWVEGSQSGTACQDGVTWNTRNCVTAWTAGGDYDAAPVGSVVVDPTSRFVSIDVTSLVADWANSSKPNYGFLLVPGSAVANRILSFPSREQAAGPMPAARLVVVTAQAEAYTTQGVNQCKAEIVPTVVLAGATSQRFVYSFLADIGGSRTGIERFTIGVPLGFAFVSLDTVQVASATLVANTDAVLTAGEFERWGSSPAIDVRFWPPLVNASPSFRIDAVFHASVPAIADPGKEFLSVVDHDRRGYPAQNTARGDANGHGNDANTWTVVTVPGIVTSLTVTPRDTTVAAGHSVAYRAFATYSDQSVVEVTSGAIWIVNPPALGAFEAAPGVLVTHEQGDGNVLAKFGGVESAPGVIHVGPPALKEVAVTPPGATVAAGLTTQFQADASFSDGSSLRITDVAIWSVADSTVATMVTPGVARGLATGSTVLLASYGGLSGNATLDVTPPQLIAIAVSPADTTVALGGSAQLRASGTYTDGSTHDVSGIATWNATPNGIVDIDANGLASTLVEGIASVTASVGGVASPAARFVVGPAELLSIATAPTDTMVALGFDVPYRAVGTYSDGSTRNLASSVFWDTQPTGIATFGPTGIAATIGAGSTTITASWQGVTSPPATLTVGPAIVVELDGAPDVATVPFGSPHAVTSTARYSDGSSVDVTGQAAWQSLDPSIADFDAPGSLQTLARGTAHIVHAFSGVQGDTLRLTVTTATIDSVVVSPCGTALPPGLERQFIATAYFSDFSAHDATSQATWSSSDPAVATIAAGGRATAVAAGTTHISAIVLGVASSPCDFDVDPNAVTAIEIAPNDTTLAAGQVLQYTATGRVGSEAYDMTALVGWTIGDPSIASITTGGRVTALEPGSTNVGASYASAAGSATLSVVPGSIVQMDVLPASSTVRLGTTKTMTARATYSNATTADVTALATWTSDAPTIVYADAAGVARALALGNAHLTATYASVTSPPALLTVLPDVQIETVPTGVLTAVPGSVRNPVLGLRFVNGYLDVRRITALQIAVAGPASQATLHVDDGDGVFESMSDAVVATGIPAGGFWSATALGIDLPVGSSKTLFVSLDASATGASHGDILNATIPDIADVFWQSSTAVVASESFPLDGAGHVLVQDLALAQIAFTASGDSVLAAGAQRAALFEMHLPADGLLDDTLDHLEIVQRGSAREDIDVTALRLQSYSAAWQDVATLVPSGGNRWTATGIGVAVPAAGLLTRLVADIAPGAATDRTLRIELPALALGFASGRRGPIDAGWLEPVAHRIDSPRLVVAQGVDIATGTSIARSIQRVPVLGLDLTARGVLGDELEAIRFDNLTRGPGGSPADPNAEIAVAELWQDRNADGAVGAADSLLAVVSPPSGNSITFGMTSPLGLWLDANSTKRLLVAVSPDSERVRDAEELRLRFAALVTQGGLAAQSLDPLEPTDPPVVDGQAAAGYHVRPIANTLVTAGSTGVLVLDLVIPSNGFDADVLERLRITNSGSALASDVQAVRLLQDDGDGQLGSGDAPVGTLAASGQGSWEATGLGVTLPGGTAGRFYVVVDMAPNATFGHTFEAHLSLGDIEVASGNDGPNDHPLAGGGPITVTAYDEILWVAGVASSHVVRPDARRRIVLVLETLNSYPTRRTLLSLRVALRGTTAPFEYDHWELYADANENGSIDAEETPLALATPAGSELHFEGFNYDLEPFDQQRLLVAYSLAPGLARDGSIIDAAIEAAGDFGYSVADGGTATTAQFEIDSPGQDQIDGHVASQVGNTTVVPQSLGGGETNILGLDLTLPSNGWEADILNALEVALTAGPNAAQLGPDIAAIRLWREADVDFSEARFEPGQDVLLETLLPGAGALRFGSLATAIPVGGRRFYVTLDIAASPSDGREIQLRVPQLGIQMVSGNDGPVDVAVVGTATHRISASALLATVASLPFSPTVGQPIDVAVVVRNRGSEAVGVIVPHRIDIEPPLASTLLAGPVPAQLALAPAASDTLHYSFQIDAPGRCNFVAVVGTPDSSIVSEPAAGPILDVRRPASALVLEPRSNLPAVVSRGQAATPIIWKLVHGDDDPLAGSILVRSLELQVGTATGAPQSAASVFRRLEIRSGGIVRALLEPVPDTSAVALDLDPPLVLRTGESLDLPLETSIASDAVATSFQVRIAGTQVAEAVDAGSGQPIPVQASLPWTSPTTQVRTVATQVSVELLQGLPPGVNRGQRDVPLGSLRFSLPGNPGESEARVLRLAIAWHDSAGAPLDPRSLCNRIEVWSGAALLLGIDVPSDAGGRVLLPLLIPRSLASGAPEDLALRASLRDDAPLGMFEIGIEQPSDLVVQDATSGSPVQVVPVPPASFPASLGASRVYEAARSVEVTAISRLPAASAGGASLDVVALNLRSPGGAGSADVLLRGVQVRITDPQGSLLVPRTVLASLDVRQGASVLGEAAVIPSGPDAVVIQLTPPPRIAAGGQLDLVLHADLIAAPAVASFRFALEGSPLDLIDANDPDQPVFPTGTLPFATSTLEIVVAPSVVELGITQDPPANIVWGQSGASMLRLLVRHPGAARVAPLDVGSLAVYLEDLGGQPLAAARIVRTALLRTASATVQATVAGDSLHFDLSAWPAVDAGQSLEAALEIDVPASSDVQDFRFTTRAGSLRATAGSSLLGVQALAGHALPYRSPTVHVGAPDLASSFANYPNPFAAGRESTRIPFYLASDASVTVEVCTLTGERVIRLLDSAPLPAGLHDDLAWNGRNGRGEIVRNGAYILCIDVSGPGGGKLRRKLAVLR